MDDFETVRVWKDPDDDGRAVVAEHPAGPSEFGELFGGLAQPNLIPRTIDTCGSYPDWCG